METVAIIGTGIAGMGAAYHLKDRYDLTIYEQHDYIGGHTNTIIVKEENEDVYIDTGFMVFNFETYPHLCRLFKEIDATIKKSDMSFSVQFVPEHLEYCGSGIDGLFAQRKNIFRPSYIKMLLQIARFNKEAIRILDDPHYENHTLGQFINEFRFGQDMLWKYLVPMSSAVWSTPMESMLDFPAQTLVRFFKNHGFLGLNSQHQWYTPDKGSQSYREKLILPFVDRIQTNNAVISVKRNGNRAVVVSQRGQEKEFDKVIFASHADQSLKMNIDPTAEERRLLSAFRYQHNRATVHTDESIMPRNKKVWSSWNYRVEEKEGKMMPSTIYWMNRLQEVSKKKNYFVSINAIPGSINPSSIIREIDYEHPLFNLAAIQAQKELHKLNEQGPFYYCGSYFKYGFHEDAYASAVELSKQLLN